MSEKKDALSKVSEEFWDALIHSGSAVIDCEFCHRTHFVDDRFSNYEKGELEKLHKQNKENPDSVIFHSDESSVSWGHIDGKQAVYDCPCNYARLYEDFIWNSRHIISKYLSKRAEKMIKMAEEEKGLSKRINDALNNH